MSVPSMVHRSGDSLIVRSVVSGNALYGSFDDVAAEEGDDYYIDDSVDSVDDNNKDLPDCKVKRNYSCSNCEFFTQNPRHFLYHLRDVHKEKVKIYECPNCLYASKHFQKLLRHTKMVHGSSDGIELSNDVNSVRKSSKKRTAPPVDEEEISSLDCLEDDPIFKCSVCTFTSRNQSQLSRHEREEHIKTKFFRCSKCTYVTHIRARFTKHVKYHSMPMIKCDMCDFRTPYKWNLDRHCKNHNGRGAFRCSACNFTADIKQSLTVHEMNHHVPPVGQAAGLGVGRRRNKVGASDATAAEEAAQQQQAQTGKNDLLQDQCDDETTRNKAKIKQTNSTTKKPKTSHHSDTQQSQYTSAKSFGGSDFIHPDDIIHHSNGKVYIKNKCKLCNYKSAWDGEMAKHERKVHNINREQENNNKTVKKSPRPIPNLIPIPSSGNSSSILKVNHFQRNFGHPPLKVAEIPSTTELPMSQKDINDICAKSSNSALKDFASLFSSEDVFENITPKLPELIPAKAVFTSTPKTVINNNNNNNSSNSSDIMFKQKNASFFDKLKERLEASGSSNNLTCSNCGYESKCMTEQAKHQQICGKNSNKTPRITPIFNLSSSRCQYCRQRCKSSNDLMNHFKTCAVFNSQKEANDSMDTLSEPEGELRIDEDRIMDDDETDNSKPHPMENKVFVWNDIHVPMDIEVDDSNYEYTEDKVDNDNVSLDLSIRTQSPGGSENSYLGLELNSTPNHRQSPANTTDKIPTHGNDISIAQHHKRVFKCPHCTFWASTASRFHVHIVGHLNKKPFECSLCSYRSNWRWDITKHIKLKSVRDQAHESAKVLMTDETGRRNYTKYNKYLTEIPVSGDQSMETSGGSGTRPKHHDRNSSPSNNKSDLPKLIRAPNSTDFSPLLKSSPLRPPPPLKAAEASKRSSGGTNSENKRTQFKCKQCNFRDPSKEILLEHVKGHYPKQGNGGGVSSLGLGGDLMRMQSSNSQDLRGTSPDKDEASVNNTTAKGGSQAPFRCGHCNQVSNWKHVIQRHCRLKHSGDIRVVSNKNGQEKIEIEEQSDDPPDHMDIEQDGTYKCSFCPFSNNDNVTFENHLSGHDSSIDYTHKCCYCKYFSTTKEDIIEHFKLHGITDPSDDLLSYLERGGGGSNQDNLKKFKCKSCPYITNSKSQYTYHIQFHKPKGELYSCSECSYNVSKRHLLHQHYKVHGININPKPNDDIDDMLMSDEIEEVPCLNQSTLLDTQNYPDIPLVWVSKGGKFSKMFKCRFCPHVNLRKVNIQEHEKMHSVRERNPNATSRLNDVEHRCTECNYVCNNAGVLSSHSKVHQGMYGVVHRLVDPSRSDEEQIRELTQFQEQLQHIDENSEIEDDHDEPNGLGLFFCSKCPSRFFKENEYNIHKNFHGSRLFYKCDYCSYTARQKPYLLAHSKVHRNDYQNRTKELKEMYGVHPNCVQPKTYCIKAGSGETVWIVIEERPDTNEFLMEQQMNNYKPSRGVQNVPLSGTDLFLQKSEAQQKFNLEAAAAAAQIRDSSIPIIEEKTDPQFGNLMLGNPKFIYPTYLKNGRMKEKRYKCHKCPSAFEKREQYKVHLGLHGSKQRYNCDHCDYSVKYYANFVQHLKKHKQNDDAQAAALTGEQEDEEFDEENQNVGLSDLQMLSILQQRKINTTSENNGEEKKVFWCPNCPYSSHRKDAVENHQKRHFSISGTKSQYACEHCDYSAPQAHFLRDHVKLHFAPSAVKNNNHIDNYMHHCDNMKLTTKKMEDDEAEENVIFEEKVEEERFNNNEGEKKFVNLQTGELIAAKESVAEEVNVKSEEGDEDDSSDIKQSEPDCSNNNNNLDEVI